MGEIRIELDAANQTTTLRAGKVELGQAAWQIPALSRAHTRFSESRSHPVRRTGREAVLIRQAGEELFAALFPEDLGRSLDGVIDERLKPLGGVASLVFEVPTPVSASLRVETLVSPTHSALASHARVRLLRRTGAAAEMAALPAPPLRVLFVVASPDSLNRKGRLLDYELEEWVLASSPPALDR